MTGKVKLSESGEHASGMRSKKRIVRLHDRQSKVKRGGGARERIAKQGANSAPA